MACLIRIEAEPPVTVDAAVRVTSLVTKSADWLPVPLSSVICSAVTVNEPNCVVTESSLLFTVTVSDPSPPDTLSASAESSNPCSKLTMIESLPSVPVMFTGPVGSEIVLFNSVPK